jgi:outer membrane protein TolC
VLLVPAISTSTEVIEVLAADSQKAASNESAAEEVETEVSVWIEPVLPTEVSDPSDMEWLSLALSVEDFRVPTDHQTLINYLAEDYVAYEAEVTLEQAVELALTHNHDLNSKRMSAAAACQGVKVNWADLRPQLSLQGKAFYQETNAGTISIGPPDEQESPDLSLSTEGELIKSLAISLTQRIYDFGLTNDLIDLSSAQHAIEYYTVQMAEQQLVHDVIVGYYTYNLALGQLRIRSDELTLSEEFLRQTRIQYDVGTVPWLDVIRAEARVELARASLIAAQAQVGDAAALFFSLLGMEDQRYLPTIITARLIEPGFPPHAADSAVDSALTYRPEIQLQYAALFAGEASRSLTQNRPVLQAYANAMFQKPTSSFQGTDSYEYGVQLMWNLYTGGKDKLQREQAELQLRSLSEAVLDLEAKVELDTTTAWNRLTAARSSIHSARKTLELSAEGLRAAAVGYAADVTPYIEFEDALNQNVAASLAYLFALVEVKLSQANLARAQGFPEGYPGDPRSSTPASTTIEAVLGLEQAP